MTERPLAAEEVIRMLDLLPHPEGGFYRETFRDRPADGGRGASTAIYYLLRAGETSAWHRVTDAAETWHHYTGAPLALTVSADGRESETCQLGNDLASGERPQATVPAGAWQSAKPLGDWTLVGCTVAPAFEFGSFEMAPAGWAPETAGGAQ
ncbi:MAG TPA: cupin domain-containing protein [Thermoanaerobaculia bacterium]|nr:cupin domain-containing protein [Thermoanaerobaculia bacterium]